MSFQGEAGRARAKAEPGCERPGPSLPRCDPCLPTRKEPRIPATNEWTTEYIGWQGKGWDLSLPEMEGTKPPGSNVTPFGISTTVRRTCAQHSTAPQRTSGSHPSSTRNALRAESNSSNPPRFRAFRRGGIYMLGHTSGLKKSAR
ncbi:hypothetical protein INR49_005347 [Caranx melampygus]|nr:hypothetical protein INR49_005347 [Caranx melampygus]